LVRSLDVKSLFLFVLKSTDPPISESSMSFSFY